MAVPPLVNAKLPAFLYHIVFTYEHCVVPV